MSEANGVERIVRLSGVRRFKWKALLLVTGYAVKLTKPGKFNVSMQLTANIINVALFTEQRIYMAGWLDTLTHEDFFGACVKIIRGFALIVHE